MEYHQALDGTTYAVVGAGKNALLRGLTAFCMVASIGLLIWHGHQMKVVSQAHVCRGAAARFAHATCPGGAVTEQTLHAQVGYPTLVDWAIAVLIVATFVFGLWQQVSYKQSVLHRILDLPDDPIHEPVAGAGADDREFFEIVWNDSDLRRLLSWAERRMGRPQRGRKR